MIAAIVELVSDTWLLASLRTRDSQPRQVN